MGESQSPWKELYGCLAAVMHHSLSWHDVPSGHQSHRKYYTFVIPPLCNNASCLHSSTAQKQTSLSKISPRVQTTTPVVRLRKDHNNTEGYAVDNCNGRVTTTAVSTPTDGSWNEANQCIASHRRALRFGRRMILGLGFERASWASRIWQRNSDFAVFSPQHARNFEEARRAKLYDKSLEEERWQMKKKRRNRMQIFLRKATWRMNSRRWRRNDDEADLLTI